MQRPSKVPASAFHYQKKGDEDLGWSVSCGINPPTSQTMPIMTGKVALANLNEFPDYYDRLEKMGKEADIFPMLCSFNALDKFFCILP